MAGGDDAVITLCIITSVVYLLIGVVAVVCWTEGNLQRATKRLNERWPPSRRIE